MSIEKNKKIKQTLAKTKERRKSKKCFVFKTKINKQKLNAVQREQLDRLFLEAKWFYNHAINFMQTHKLSELDTKVRAVTTLDRVFECGCSVSMDRDVHAAQCMVWMADNGYANILQTKKKKKYTVGRGDVEKQTSTVKSYDGNIIAEPCCLCSDSKFASMKHETHRSLASR